jgi:excisionase family DNA binding protein
MRTSHIDPDKLYSVDEAAAIASTSRRTLLRALSRGRVAVVMIGGRKIQRAELAGG